MSNASDRPEPDERTGSEPSPAPDPEPGEARAFDPGSTAAETEAPVGEGPAAGPGVDGGEGETAPRIDLDKRSSETGAAATEPAPAEPAAAEPPAAEPPAAAPAEQPQPGYPPQYGPQPGYGPQGHEQPGYGPPGYGQPPYGPPDHGQSPYPPGYGQPSYPPPGYGQSPYPPAAYGQSPYGPAAYGQSPYPPAGYGQPPYGPPGYGQTPYPPPGYPQSAFGPPPGNGQPPFGGSTGQQPGPGIVPLRPLGVGDMLAGVVAYIRANPLATIGLTAAVMVVTQVLQLIVELVLPQIDPAELAEGRIGGLAASLSGAILSAVVSIVLSAALTGLLLVVLSRAVLGQRIGVTEAWQALAPRVPGLIGLTLLIGLAVGGIAMVIVMIAVVVGATGSGSAIGLGVLLVLFAVAGVAYLSVLWALAPAAYVLEPIGVTEALGRSIRLVRGSWWRTFGILLLSGLIVVIPAIVVLGLFGAFSVASPDTGSMIMAGIASILIGTFATPFITGITGLLYVDQRIRKERLDLDIARSA